MAVDSIAWVIFLADLVVRRSIDRNYLTAQFMSVFRLARLARLVSVTGLGASTIEVLRRLGTLGIRLGATSVVAALIVMRAEPPESGFETFGDALCWAMVSFTTVGYGDLFPVTPLGRFAAMLMMLAGLPALGTVAAVVGVNIGSNDSESEGSPTNEYSVRSEHFVARWLNRGNDSATIDPATWQHPQVLAALNIGAVLLGVAAAGLTASVLGLALGFLLTLVEVERGADIGLIVGILVGLAGGGWVAGIKARHSERFHGAVTGLLVSFLVMIIARLGGSPASTLTILWMAAVALVISGLFGWLAGTRKRAHH